MPELPEVETIVRYLRPKISGRKILDMDSDTPRLFRDHRSRTSTELKSDFKKVREQVLGRKIGSLERIGKNIILKLSGGKYLVLHLMMTGKLLLNPAGRRAHDRLQIRLSGKMKLVFNDIRKFGRCRVLSSSQNLGGPDALSLNLETFKFLFRGRTASIKSILLNQKLINGIGNIYSDEILWQAGIHPARPGESLTKKEIKKIFNATKSILNLAIKKEGATLRDYKKPDGTAGGYYQIRKVYQRTGEKCARDGAIIRRIKIAGRSTHFCPKHQK